MLKDWNACAREVGRALSRYDGQTTRVKGGLETILSVPASPLFDVHASCLAALLNRETQEQVGIEERSSAVNLLHGINLGFLYRAVPAGQNLSKIALSSLGRAYRAALKGNNVPFRDFLVVGAILDHDFDLYGMLLDHASENESGAAASNSVREQIDGFRRRLEDMCKQRQAWLDAHIPSRPVKERIATYIQWLQPSGKLVDAPKTIEHHFNLRRQWGRHLGHLDEKNKLTKLGHDICQRVRSVVSGNSMFWIAPAPDCARKVGVVSNVAECIFSGWDLLRPSGPEKSPGSEMVQGVADFMESAFDAVRLHSFAQAPLAVVIPYVHYQEHLLGYKVNLRSLFQMILEQRRDTLHCALLGVLENSQYRLRKIPISARVVRSRP